jgi:hypothetical protein
MIPLNDEEESLHRLLERDSRARARAYTRACASQAPPGSRTFWQSLARFDDRLRLPQSTLESFTRSEA